MDEPTDSHAPSPDLPVEHLVAGLLRAGPQEASTYAAEIIQRFEPALRHAWRQGAFDLEYQDFVQDVFVRLFGSLRSLRNPKAFPGFLYQVARSVAASHARRSTGSKPEPLDLALGLPDRFDERLLAGIFVRSYLEELPPREQEVAKMAFLEERTSEDIALELKLTPGAVRATKARAASRLRKILFKEAEALEREVKDR
ncbi:MAG TPA: sigma-70 family RNA polymerase sigma factor [Thermoanaerobaculia bacterium]|nr:sigma-70 family RNA polymerase sigma factor [Thermoanaerobaculia bacterium]